MRPSYRQKLMRDALNKEHLTFKEVVCFYNKHGRLQYLDYVVRYKGRLVVILWSNYHIHRNKRWKWHSSGLKEYERVNWEQKIEFLEERGLPYLIVGKRIKSSDEYRMKVRIWLHSL